MKKQKITPFLWYDDNAEEAVKFYCEIFPNSKILNISRYDEAGAQASGRKAGSIMVIEFSLDGQTFSAINGGPIFKFNESVSFVISCKDQQEVDYYWNKLTSNGGREIECGWLKDKYGLSWQVTPEILGKMMTDKDKKRAGRVFKAMLSMKKMNVKKLEEAYEGI